MVNRYVAVATLVAGPTLFWHTGVIMARFALFVLALLPLGCIPVDEPLGDPDKVEPDTDLVGSWKSET